MHSFLEVVPIMALVSVLALHPAQTAALVGAGDEQPSWRLRFKQPPLDKRYLAAILGCVTLFGVLPYAEELLRCYRTDRTFKPHRPAEPRATQPA
jgi:hypothetical protein